MPFVTGGGAGAGGAGGAGRPSTGADVGATPVLTTPLVVPEPVRLMPGVPVRSNSLALMLDPPETSTDLACVESTTMAPLVDTVSDPLPLTLRAPEPLGSSRRTPVFGATVSVSVAGLT